MAIATQNATYLTGGPTATNQIIVNSPLSDTEVALPFLVTLTLDGTATSATLNFIDGTAVLPFTPRAVVLTVVGGTQLSAGAVPNVAAGTPTSTGCTIYIGAAGTAANTIILAGEILK